MSYYGSLLSINPSTWMKSAALIYTRHQNSLSSLEEKRKKGDECMQHALQLECDASTSLRTVMVLYFKKKVSNFQQMGHFSS